MKVTSLGNHLLLSVLQPIYYFEHYQEPSIGMCSYPLPPPLVSFTYDWASESSWECITKQKGEYIYGDKSKSTESNNGKTMVSLIIRVHTKIDYFHGFWSIH